jgi:hypothetical protein
MPEKKKTIALDEDDYIAVSDLRTIRHVQELLRSLIPENNSRIPKDELKVVNQIVWQWDVALSSALRIRG